MNPHGLLAQGSDGNFYGTAYTGGTSNYGTVFQITPAGTLTNLHSFTGPDGSTPQGALVEGSDGNFYGTAAYGGAYSKGTVFRISPSGDFTNLYFFKGSSDGARPFAGLVQGSDGNFYGTTAQDGNTNLNGGLGYGTVFRMSSSGVLTSLYSFTGAPDGGGPVAGLVQGRDGNFYGTATEGGITTNGELGGYGTVFRISPSGSYTILYAFVGPPNDGSTPTARLVLGSDGSFYGTTQLGGINGSGTVFRISCSGNYTNLYPFGNYVGDGASPVDGLVQGGNGNFYGTAIFGGIDNKGTVYRLSVPLNPPANQISAIRLSGSNSVFNVPSVAGETYQLQFSSSMTPTNWINEGGSITSIGALLTLTNLGGAVGPQGFYRFAITQ